jgi:hypothetical protein
MALLPEMLNSNSRIESHRSRTASMAPNASGYNPSTISVARRANANDIASRNRKTALASRISIPANT